jgi:hypothetical protein
MKDDKQRAHEMDRAFLALASAFVFAAWLLSRFFR